MDNKLIRILILAISIAILSACSPEHSGGSPYNPAKDNQAPVIKIHYSNVDITGVEKISIISNQLHIGSLVVASWSDNATQNCTVSMKIDGDEVSSGTAPIVSGALTLTVTDAAGNASTATITLVLKEVHPDITIYKTEVNVYGGARLNIRSDHLSIGGEIVMAWNDQYTTNCTVIVTKGDNTLQDGDLLSEAGTLNVTVTNRQGKSSSAVITLVSKAPYKHIAINDLKPGDILPIVDQVQTGDRQIYYHTEHLRLAEAIRISDMMWEYGAGSYTVDDYRQLMDRLSVIMGTETPQEYTDFDYIGESSGMEPSDHSDIEWFILETLVKHVNRKVLKTGYPEWGEVALNYFSSHPASFNIIGCSAHMEAHTKDSYDKYFSNSPFIAISDLDNVIIFASGSNIRRNADDGGYTTKIYQGDIDSNGDPNGGYREFSFANGKNDEVLNHHAILSFATNASGDYDLTNDMTGSRFPIGFHDDVCFSSREFPHYEKGKLVAATGNYKTSFPNYVNVAMASIAFQLKADIEDADELLTMLRSTSCTDYIRFEGQTQPLHLINLAGVIQKYLMPEALPTVISTNEAIPLEPGFYHGVFFDIPGAEVLIDGEWVRVSAENEQLIKAQNPFTLKYRLNGEELINIGYQPGDTVTGIIKLIDDQWGGLRLEKEFKVTLIN